MIGMLFMRLEAIYGSVWTNRLTTDESHAVAVDEWGRQLNGLTEQQLRIGLNKLTGRMPVTPKELKDLCLNREDDTYGTLL